MIVYAFVQSAVKHALAQFSITPTLDFELDAGIQNLDAVNKPFTDEIKSSAASSSLYQTFTQKNQAHFVERQSDLDWPPRPPRGEMETFYGKEFPAHQSPQQTSTANITLLNFSGDLLQVHNAYIVVQNDKGYLLVNQQNAHERILYERFSNAVAGKAIATQSSLFPSTIELSAADTVLLNELLPDLHQLGYLLEPFGNNTFVIQGTPADLLQGNEKTALEKMLEQYKHFSNDLKFSRREKLLRSMSLQQSIKSGTSLTQKEMQVLLEELFACKVPNSTPNGKPTYMNFKKEELDKMFGR